MKLALLYIPDLFFAPRIADALKLLGFTTSDMDARGDVTTTLQGADLLVAQLNGPRETWLTLIATASKAGIPVLAFGRHTEPETLRAARQAGAKAVPNSELVTELPQLVAEIMKAKLP
jgi:putative N-acetylmannosamine-6-phosphate epimerase